MTDGDDVDDILLRWYLARRNDPSTVWQVFRCAVILAQWNALLTTVGVRFTSRIGK